MLVASMLGGMDEVLVVAVKIDIFDTNDNDDDDNKREEWWWW